MPATSSGYGSQPETVAVRRRRPTPVAPLPSVVDPVTAASQAAAAAVAIPTTVPASNNTQRTQPALAALPPTTSPIERLQAIAGLTGTDTTPLQDLLAQGRRAINRAIGLADEGPEFSRQQTIQAVKAGDLARGSEIGTQRRELLTDAARYYADNPAPKPDMEKVAVPAFVPPEYRKYVAKFGSKFVDPVAQGTGLTGPEYLANTLQFESGFNRNAVSPRGAADLGQFMPGTAATFESEYGVDPIGGSAKDAIKGSAMHLSGEFGHPALYAGYNPGYGGDPIVGMDPGPEVNVKIPETGGLSAQSAAPQPPPRQRFLNRVEISPGLPTAEDLGVKNDNAAINKIHPDLQRALMRLSRQTGIEPVLNEGWRTRDYQAFLANTVSGPVAAPGQSKHESGLAVDIDNYGAYTEEQLNAAGLGHMVANDPEHLQLLNEPAALVGPLAGSPAAGGTVAPSGTAPGYAPTGASPLEATLAGAGAGTPQHDRRAPVPITPIQNPLSARPALPQGLSNELAAILGLAPEGTSQAPTLLDLLRPDRRL